MRVHLRNKPTLHRDFSRGAFHGALKLFALAVIIAELAASRAARAGDAAASVSGDGGLARAWNALRESQNDDAPKAEEKKPAVAAIAARLEQRGDKAKLIFETTANVVASAFPVTNPDRIIVDIPEMAFVIDSPVGPPAPAAKSGGASDGLIKSYRFGLFAPGRSRVVIDLNRPSKVIRAASEDTPKGPTLVIELARSDKSSFAAAAAEHARAVAPAPEKSALPPTKFVHQDRPIVVIDPGHGGVDVGAAGAHGELEKAIVFEFARALQTRLETGGRVHALMTRGDDIFIALDDRVRFAQQNNASLFLSIHADTLGESTVRGATIYTVSGRASDSEAERIAEKENFADQAAGLVRKEEKEEVGDILYDLTRRETRAYSRQFADTLLGKWKDAGSLNKNPSRSASFVVLKAHDIPSVLLELGYLSSEKDLANLTSPQWREQAADTTAKAIEAFFTARDQQAQGIPPTFVTSGRPQ
jgi:N-acetylmuramoyl-L-alanine amidase